MEIKVQDLRIGNLIYYFGKVRTVIKICKENSQWYIGCSESLNDLMNCWNVIDSFDAIPLTEEWLLKFGFDHSQYKFGFFEKGSVYIFKNNFDLHTDDSEYGVSEYSVEIKTVHQLQNLFYSLTGEELTIK